MWSGKTAGIVTTSGARVSGQDHRLRSMVYIKMERNLITSSTLRAVGFDDAHNILEAEFASGLIYQYFGVPQRIYNGLLSAPSKGRYFNLHIRDCYPTRKIGD